MKLRLAIWLLVGFFMANLPLKAQVPISPIKASLPTDSLTGQLRLGLNNFNYFRNYEYSNSFHDGYTLFGSQLETQLQYFAHPNLLLSLGAYMRKDFGQDGLYEVQPLIQVHYHKNDLSLIFGRLESNTAQAYMEPLYNPEFRLTQPLNYGTQVKIQEPGYRLDAWLSWEKMIYPKDEQKEEILGGLVFEPRLLKKSRHDLTLPFQFLAYHKGGQIDALKNIPLSTWTNTALGLKYQYRSTGRIRNLFTENYWVISSDHSPEKQWNFTQGKALYANIGLESTWGNLKLSYWNSRGFINFRGMPLYSSVSNTVYDKGYTQRQRELLLVQYVFQKELVPNFYVDLRFEPHFDLGTSRANLQFHHSLFLSYKTSFKLFAPKN